MELFEQIKDSVNNNNLEELSRLSKIFAKEVTLNISNGSILNLKDICLNLAAIRDDIKIEKDINYYMGYIYAYENISRKLLKEKEDYLNINALIERCPSVINIMVFLNIKKIATDEEIVKRLNISIEDWGNFLDKEHLYLSKLLGINNIGNKKYYYLTSFGKETLNNKINNIEW